MLRRLRNPKSHGSVKKNWEQISTLSQTIQLHNLHPLLLWSISYYPSSVYLFSLKSFTLGFLSYIMRATCTSYPILIAFKPVLFILKNKRQVSRPPCYWFVCVCLCIYFLCLSICLSPLLFLGLWGLWDYLTVSLFPPLIFC